MKKSKTIQYLYVTPTTRKVDERRQHELAKLCEVINEAIKTEEVRISMFDLPQYFPFKIFYKKQPAQVAQ